MPAPKSRVVWSSAQGTLAAFEPTREEVKARAAALAAAYNEPYNRSMMGHQEMSEMDVREYFAQGAAHGARLFLLTSDGELMGDADFRHIEDGQAEFAIMIGGRNSQGKGLGTRFALMLHAFAFRALALERIFITVIAANAPSRRLFEKLGYQVDGSPRVRAHVDHESDVGMSIDRATFERLHAAALGEIEIS